MELVPHSYLALIWLAVSILVPVLALYLAYRAKSGPVTTKSLLILMGLQLCLSGAGFLSLETGEIEEEKVEGLIEKKFIQEHESSAEVAVGLGSLGTILAITLVFLNHGLRQKLLVAVAGLGLLSGALGLRVHQQGKDLVKLRLETPEYDKKSQEILEKAPGEFGTVPTPSVNESLKTDDNDYEPTEEDPQLEDDSRQED